jgi:hypothetical protein
MPIPDPELMIFVVMQTTKKGTKAVYATSIEETARQKRDYLATLPGTQYSNYQRVPVLE